MKQPSHPLEGLRVLDLSRLLPGPYCSLVLADLGATVTKIEDTQRGDYLRWMPPFWPNREGELLSAAFAALNRNKQSVSLNLKHPRGPELLLALAREADVLIESFRPGVLDKLGVGYSRLSEANPRLIVCSISGYGQTGPLRERAGHDLNYVARAGVLALNAREAEPPHPLSVQVADLAAGALFPATGILAALYGRERSGHGAHLDASMTDGCVALMPFLIPAMVSTAQAPVPGGETLHGGVAAYSVYPCLDGKYLAVGALEPKFWQQLCEALDRPELASGGLLSGDLGREVWRELAAIFQRKPQHEWVRFFSALDCCVEPVQSLDDVFSDRLFRERGLFIDVEQGGRAMRQVRTPVFFAHEPAPRREPAPGLGEHTDQALAAAGVSAADLAVLRSEGAIK